MHEQQSMNVPSTQVGFGLPPMNRNENLTPAGARRAAPSNHYSAQQAAQPRRAAYEASRYEAPMSYQASNKFGVDDSVVSHADDHSSMRVQQPYRRADQLSSGSYSKPNMRTAAHQSTTPAPGYGGSISPHDDPFN